MGKRKKTGGRTKGTPNKLTKPMREAFNELLENNTDKMQNWLDRVAKDDPAKALEIIHKYSDFFLPKLTRTEIQDTTSVEYFLSLTPQERKRKILEIKKNQQDEK